MSRDSVVMIVGEFEKQVNKKYPQKFSKSRKIHKKEKNYFNDVIDPGDDVIISSIIFKKNLVVTYLHAKNQHSSASGFRDRWGGGGQMCPPPPG